MSTRITAAVIRSSTARVGSAILIRLARPCRRFYWCPIVAMCCGCSSDGIRLNGVISEAVHDSTIVQYGESHRGLEFVVITRSSGERNTKGRVITTNTRQGGTRAHVVVDGRRTELPLDVQLLEFVDERLQTSELRITTEQLQSWLASHPRTYSLASLEDFVSAAGTGAR